jgi:hypothetical protein
VLFEQLRQVLRAQVDGGEPLHCRQDPFSLAALDRAVRALLANYVSVEGPVDGTADWQRYAHFSEEHYLRNLVQTEVRM